MICQIRRWKEMDRWDWIRASSVVAHSRNRSHSSIHDFLSRRVEPVDKAKTPFSEIVPISIHFDGSISKRLLKEGREYSLPMLWVRPGDVVLSKIDLKNGAVGLLPNDWAGVAVTTHFAVYEPDRSKVLPEYFRLLIQTPLFKAWLAENKSGQDGRTEVKLPDFEELEVPLPSLQDQRRLVAAYQKALNKAAELEAQALQIERDAQREFETALGLTPPQDLPKRPFQIARFRDIERWSHEGILQAGLLGDAPPESMFEIVQLGDIATVSYGLQKCPTNRPDKHARPYLRVANVQRDYLDLREIKMINVPDTDMPKYRLEDGDILLCEGNSADLVGRGAIWRNEIADCVHQNHVLRVRLDRRRAIPEFILAYINSPSGQTYFRSKAKRTTNLASINSKEVANLAVPLPEDTATQVAIVRLLKKGREAVGSKRKRAAELRTVAWSGFIAAVFA
jgi:type I restriction enzyme, S subunit